ncbi:hypothetical protein Q9L42_005715 [Methylomarinum sp. Ch1-1]|uniref:Uncharacterized protein n=1 Tax=Methylomarinum roseum TaxID=3067653 RepID=A0AAU7NXD4_9GAMM|nr:hypothetical protein [Methylomarinum sp. Ch1-1]MDP4522295.1 hypothetical protein [Methylomarinum sp. Ch1-1]
MLQNHLSHHSQWEGMMNHPNSHLIAKVLFLGILIAALVYLFHPGVGQLSLIINGEPVPEPWAGLAAIPVMLLVLIFSAVLMLLVCFGVGVFFFFLALLFAFGGLMLVAPYFSPILFIIMLVVALMSIGNGDKG